MGEILVRMKIRKLQWRMKAVELDDTSGGMETSRRGGSETFRLNESMVFLKVIKHLRNGGKSELVFMFKNKSVELDQLQEN